jgi:thymidylate synthase
MVEIKEKTAEKAWKKLLKYVLENGNDFIDRKNRLCKEALNITVTIESVEGITKPLEILSSFKKWVYPSLEELKSFMLENKDVPGYYYHYGARAFNYNGIDQVNDYIIPLLKKDPTSKRGIVVFYGPEKDTLPLKKETPGVVMMNFNIRNRKLHTTIVIRSNDLFFGWPANILQAYFLAEYIGKELNCSLGTINTISISAHIFEDQFEYIRKIIGED